MEKVIMDKIQASTGLILCQKSHKFVPTQKKP